MAANTADGTRPVLMMLTSPKHPMETFLTVLRCLEAHTDLELFDRIYICANQVPRDRYTAIENFVRRHPNAEAIHCGPLGHHPCVPYVQNHVSEKHRDGVIIKMDDDMFVTPGWLEKLILCYEETKDDPDLGLITPLIPINTMGAQCLWDFMSRRYGAEFRHMWIREGGHIGANYPYHRMVWDKVLNDNMIERFIAGLEDTRMYFSGPDSHVSINCMMYDARLIDRAYPFPLHEAWFLDREKMFDESIINRHISRGEIKGLAVLDSVVHHYAFNRVEDDIRKHFPMQKIARHILNLKPLPEKIRSISRPCRAMVA